MKDDGQPTELIKETARKCGRIIHACAVGAFCRSEMLNQLDQIVPPGSEAALLDNLEDADLSRLTKIYQNSNLTRDSYNKRYRVHLVICDSNIVADNSD